MLSTLKKFFEFCPSEYRAQFRASIALGMLMALCKALCIPAIALVLHGVVAGNITTGEILGSLVLMLASIMGEGLLRGRCTALQTEAGYGTATDKRIGIAEHLRYLPLGYFNQNNLGEIASIATNTMESLQGVATRAVMMASEGLLDTALVAFCLLLFDWRPGLVLVAGTVVFFVVNAFMQRKATAVSAAKLRSDSALVNDVLEYVQGMLEVKMYGLVGHNSQKLNGSIERNVDANIAMELKLVPYQALQSVVTKATGVCMSACSIWFCLSGSMDLLVCLIMVVCSFLVCSSLESAGSYSALLRLIGQCVDRANSVLDLPVMDIDGADFQPASYDIEVRHVGFSYGSRKVIDDVSFSVPEGTTCAVVGPSGSGKTTLCSLVARLWDVDEGSVLLGGRDVREYSMDALMRSFSFVFQNVYLFNDTVANNIRFGEPEASMERVMDAARRAHCHDFIMRLPDGYDTVIGEGGESLSGGERQRLSIARALMKDAPIVVLDEATASVDPENERELMEAIGEVTRSKTLIMIAHRLKTVQDADQILVLDGGRLVARGTHDELRQQDGIYRRFLDERKAAAGWHL